MANHLFIGRFGHGRYRTVHLQLEQQPGHPPLELNRVIEGKSELSVTQYWIFNQFTLSYLGKDTVMKITYRCSIVPQNK